MRIIRFRGKSKAATTWHYGMLIQGGEDSNFTSILEAGEEYAVSPKSVGQFTGYKDKEQTDIYEGDILEKKLGNRVCRRLVIWSGAGFRLVVFGYKPVSMTYIASSAERMKRSFSEWTVIGNQIDNPELIED